MRFFAPLDNEPTPGLLAIEVATSFQIPSFHIIGLPAPEVSEARERIRAAIDNSGLEFPKRRLVVNLSPASVRKRGTGLDLAIALAILENRGENRDSASSADAIVACGELSLDGKLRSAGGVTRTVYAAWLSGARSVLLPEEDLPTAEASIHLIREATRQPNPAPSLLMVSCLADAWSLIQGNKTPESVSDRSRSAPKSGRNERLLPLLPLPALLERVILAASTGLHHVLLLGPKGSGKSYAMGWLEALQPERSPEMQLHHQLLSELRSAEYSIGPSRAPIRRVGPQVRPCHLVGTGRGQSVRPGEYPLAHGGLLIADEYPEWPRDSRESLRGPLETGRVSIPCMSGNSELPAQFLFAATGNLCPCGGWPREVPLPETSAIPGAPVPAICHCSSAKRGHYRARLSGPVLDRVDMATLVLCSSPPQQDARASVELLRSKLDTLRSDLKRRLGNLPGLLSASETEDLLRGNREWTRWLAATRVASLRSRHKVFRVALTLAAIDEGDPSPAHFAEAAFYRPEAMQL